jgi:hypothetical protein
MSTGTPDTPAAAEPSPRLPHRKRAKLDAILAHLAGGATATEACRAAGIDRKTLWRWCARYPEVAEAIAKAKEPVDQMVQAVALMKCLDPHPSNNRIRMFWLRNRMPEVFRVAARTKLAVDLAGLSDDELMRRAGVILGDG